MNTNEHQFVRAGTAVLPGKDHSEVNIDSPFVTLVFRRG